MTVSAAAGRGAALLPGRPFLAGRSNAIRSSLPRLPGIVCSFMMAARPPSTKVDQSFDLGGLVFA